MGALSRYKENFNRPFNWFLSMGALDVFASLNNIYNFFAKSHS